jgi:dimethylhistidine N-methyltransferase
MIEQFNIDVDEGLSGSPKSLPSKYFYDKNGDELFVRIMNMPEYYVTRAEYEIFKEQSGEIIHALDLSPNSYFELIELGPGDGTKTKELLKILIKENYDFDYLPIDISQNALDQLEESLRREIPDVSVKKKHGDYFTILETLKDTNHPKVVLFLGSNIGNLTDMEATEFIYKLGANLKPCDRLLLGVDLIKSAEIVRPAYDDPTGITKMFNLNLLHRINRELGGDFVLENFRHKPEYSEEDGIARSFIESSKDQRVRINGNTNTYFFKKGERIHTEISRKYNDAIINKIIKSTDFQISGKLTDSKNYFSDYILTRS